jgi:hypothetical protein
VREDSFMALGKVKGKKCVTVFEPDQSGRARPVFACTVDRILKIIRSGEKEIEEYEKKQVQLK